MILFPAVDILDGNAVRLLYGNRENVTIYGKPEEVAFRWANLGAEYLHIVDLNGAFDDSTVNADIIKSIVKNSKVPVQLGGGIKSLDKVKYCIEELGVSRVVLGTAAVVNPEIIEEATKLFGDKIVCGVDMKDGKVAIKGWVEYSELTPVELCNNMKNIGVSSVVFTDISRDGALSGVNVEATVALQNETGINVVASGGVRSIEDVARLKAENIYGAILGRALYTGDLSFTEALAYTKA